MPKTINVNVTTQIVREAMRIASKDVRAPQVVRQGLVTPVKLKATAK
jgi:hypothetical protein